MPNRVCFLFCKICRKLLWLVAFSWTVSQYKRSNVWSLHVTVGCVNFLHVLWHLFSALTGLLKVFTYGSVCCILSGWLQVMLCPPIPFQHLFLRLLWLRFLPQHLCLLFTRHHRWRMSQSQRNWRAKIAWFQRRSFCAGTRYLCGLAACWEALESWPLWAGQPPLPKEDVKPAHYTEGSWCAKVLCKGVTFWDGSFLLSIPEQTELLCVLLERAMQHYTRKFSKIVLFCN